MENEKKPLEPDYPYHMSKSETESFEAFISAIAHVVEKYGKVVLQRLEHVA